LVALPLSFDEGSAECHKLGRGFELASVCGGATLTFLESVLPRGHDFWFGGRQAPLRQTTGAGRSWLDGTPPASCDLAPFWFEGEPDDARGGPKTVKNSARRSYVVICPRRSYAVICPRRTTLGARPRTTRLASGSAASVSSAS
jgi:hypothetical protein